MEEKSEMTLNLLKFWECWYHCPRQNQDGTSLGVKYYFKCVWWLGLREDNKFQVNKTVVSIWKCSENYLPVSHELTEVGSDIMVGARKLLSGVLDDTIR